MNEKIRLIAEILSMNFSTKRIKYALKIVDEEIQSIEDKLDALEQKESLTTEEEQEQKELLEIGKVRDQEKELLLLIQKVMKKKQQLTKDKKSKV